MHHACILWFGERMKLRTKLRLKFYLSLAALLFFTIAIGAFFQYLSWLLWQTQLGAIAVKYELFMAMAVILFLMFISDIVLFFHFILKRQYW